MTQPANDQRPGAAARQPVLSLEQERGQYARTSHPQAQWFQGAGLGLFIHWGISSVHGGLDLSWGMMANTPWDADRQNRNKVPPAEYFGLAERFAPTQYDPNRWLAAAAAAGFRYAVMTTRHHDGYAMWPSGYGEFGTRTHLGGRDLVGEYVAACRWNGLKVGLYYSPPDWHYHRQYLSFNYGSGDSRFPERPHFGLHHEPVTVPPKPAGWDEQYHAYLRGQVTELLTRYGPIDLLWFDGGPAVMSIAQLHALQPGMVVNARAHGYGDYEAFECRMPEKAPQGWWELCEIWPECGWGYEQPGGERYRPLDWMLGRLRQVRGWGGNYLINVGPRPDGQLPAVYYERMAELTAWLREHRAEVWPPT